MIPVDYRFFSGRFSTFMGLDPSIIGVMLPAYWRGVFSNSGWDVEWMGDIHKSEEGHKIRAGCLNVSQETLSNVRKITGIDYSVLYNGSDKLRRIAA